MLTNEQAWVLNYLCGDYEYTSPTSIGVAWGGHHSSWSCPKLKVLVKLGLVERNKKGWYRAVRAEKVRGK